MVKDFALLEIDWITAQMYGKKLRKRQNNIPLSKNGIESFEELTDEIDAILDMFDESVYSNQKKYWRKESFR